MKNLPLPENRDMEYLYWGQFAIFQMGGRKWKTWQDASRKIVAGTNNTDAYLNGSMDAGIDPLSRKHGRALTTAFNVLASEIYYVWGRPPRIRKAPVMKKRSLKD
jgi:hypothetical protein